jgi:malate synthase
LNLTACLKPIASRVMFISTDLSGYAGVAIQTCRDHGAVLPWRDLQESKWVAAYRHDSVSVPLAAGFKGHGQLVQVWGDVWGDQQKGTNVGQVPSPMAAILAALHFHQTDFAAEQDEVLQPENSYQSSDRLSVPVMGEDLGPEVIARELGDLCRIILDYCVGFIDYGLGSLEKSIPLESQRHAGMAVIGFARQLIVNWLRHETVSEVQVRQALQKTAEEIDQQNIGALDYRPMCPGLDGHVFCAALDLIFKAYPQPYDETESILLAYRRAVKAEKGPVSSNRFEALKGTAARLERGESFSGAD